MLTRISISFWYESKARARGHVWACPALRKPFYGGAVNLHPGRLWWTRGRQWQMDSASQDQKRPPTSWWWRFSGYQASALDNTMGCIKWADGPAESSTGLCPRSLGVAWGLTALHHIVCKWWRVRRTCQERQKKQPGLCWTSIASLCRTSYMELAAGITPRWSTVCRCISPSTQDWTFCQSIRLYSSTL